MTTLIFLWGKNFLTPCDSISFFAAFFLSFCLPDSRRVQSPQKVVQRLVITILIKEVTSEGFVPSSYTIDLFIQIRTLGTTDLTLLHLALTRCRSDDHGWNPRFRTRIQDPRFRTEPFTCGPPLPPLLPRWM